MTTFHEWRDEGKYLPTFLQDFHDQKDLFKAMTVYFDNADTCPISWRDGHIYTIDWFLWFMAAHGYKLQKVRGNMEFLDIDTTISTCMKKWKSSPIGG